MTTVQALAETFLPGDDVWPSGAEVDIESHVNEVSRSDPGLRALVDRELSGLDEAARQLVGGRPFALASPPEREKVVRMVENDRPEAIRRLVELAYEAYYQDPKVHKAMAERTGYHFERSMHGVSRSSTDEILALLADQAEREPRVRTIEGGNDA